VSGRFRLDTNIVIALFAGDGVVQDGLRGAGEVFVPVPVVGELFFGALASSRVPENYERVRSFAAESGVLPCDAETGRHYGEIKSRLKSAGRPIPENDLWISALAHQHELTVVTRDEHFREVRSIEVECW
jgi:tRNA(fMet)-specific endonuclease VapC